LIHEDRIERRGNGGPGDPFTYHQTDRRCLKLCNETRADCVVGR
jgi:hypothetical protein